MPPEHERTPAEDVRVVAFFALQELLRFLDELRMAWVRGERCHIVIERKKRQAGRATISMQIVRDPPSADPR